LVVRNVEMEIGAVVVCRLVFGYWEADMTAVPLGSTASPFE
jgi:hypothetical protein